MQVFYLIISNYMTSTNGKMVDMVGYEWILFGIRPAFVIFWYPKELSWMFSELWFQNLDEVCLIGDVDIRYPLWSLTDVECGS